MGRAKCAAFFMLFAPWIIATPSEVSVAHSQDRIEITTFPLAELRAAAHKAIRLSGLQAVVLTM